MKKQFVIMASLLLFGITAAAQDSSFSQFYENPLLRNPALAGIFEGDVRVSGAFRNQWQSVTVPYRTGAASVEYKFRTSGNIYATIGMQTTYDEAGDIKLKRTAILPAINVHAPFLYRAPICRLGSWVDW